MSIREHHNKSGTVYETRFTYKDKYGRKKYYQKSGFSTPKKALKHETMMKEKIRQGLYNDNKKTFDQVVYECYEHSTLAKSTINLYVSLYERYLKKKIGNINIALIDYKILQDSFNEFAKVKSLSTCNNIFCSISHVFNYAYNVQYITNLPYSKITVKGLPKQEKNKVVTDNDFDDLIKHALKKNSIKRKSFVIALYIARYTGMREGEILALNKSDVDFNNDTITINKSLFYDTKDNQLSIKEAKTKESNSVIPLPNVLKTILINWFEENPSEIVICDNDYNYLNPHHLIDFLRFYSKKHKRITMHMLRHTYTTKLYYAGLDPKKAQVLLRHKDINTTMNVYTHIEKTSLKDEIDNIFN